MKRKTILPLIPGLCCVLLFSACKKSESELIAENCEQIQQVKITGAKTTPYYVGDTISLATNIIPTGLYRWSQSNQPNDISNDATVFISSCTKNDEGWYYLNVSYPECASPHNDSVYITVINRPATAPCSPAANTVSFSSIPDINVSCSFGIDPSWGIKTLSGYYAMGYPDFNIYFNPYWNSKEPEDGEYNLSHTITFDDYDPYSVFIASTYSSIYFQANDGKVYVTHKNGKLQVTFCNINLSGEWGGTGYNTTATGNLTAP